jgi:membrane associated rhomboid family serine protease
MMKTDAGLPARMPEPGKPLWRRFFGLPQTSPGRWSMWLGLGAFLFMFLMQILVISGQRGGNTFFDNLWLSLPALAAGLSILAAGILAAAAIFGKGERSLFSFLALLLGLFVLLFLVGEFSVPH